MYQKGLKPALANEYRFHHAAFLMRKGSLIKIGANHIRTHPKYSHAPWFGAMHAEMSLLCRARPGDEIHVLRVTKSGALRMSRPCRGCLEKMKKAGIARVRYTNDNGDWVWENL